MGTTTFEELDSWPTAVDRPTQGRALLTDSGAESEVWPSLADTSRLRGYALWNRLYMGKHQEVFEPNRKANQPAYVVLNFLKRLSVQTAFRMMGEVATVRVSRQRIEVEGLSEQDLKAFEEVLGQIAEESNWPLLTFTSALAASTYGDAVLKVIYRSKDDAVRIVNQRPWYYFPRYEVEDDQEPVEVTMAWRVPSDDENIVWLREEVHTPGKIENKLWQMSKAKANAEPDQFIRVPVPLNRLEAFADLPPVIETKLAVIPIIHIPNDVTVWSHPWGVSDYDGVQSIQDALNGRRTNTRTVLDKHAEPLLAIDESFLDEHGQLNMENIRALPIVQDEPPPQYIVWNGSLADSREESRDLELALWRAAGFSPESLGLGDAAGVESGRAMRLRENLTTATVMGKQKTWGPALRRVVWVAVQMWNAWVQDKAKGQVPFDFGPRDLEAVFGDGLPRDEVEEVQTAAQIKSASLPETDKSLLKRMHPDWSDKQIEAEVQAFDEQQQKVEERRLQRVQGERTQIGEKGQLRERRQAMLESRESSARADMGRPED